jgi:hypothetical protein
MRRSTAPAVLISAALFCAAPVADQSRPDFSGRWTTASDPAPEARAGSPAGRRGGTPGAGRGRGARAGDMGSGWGETITITQDPKTITIETAFFSRGDLQPQLRYTYPLDGSPTTIAVAMGRGTQEDTSRARWDGDALVITTSYTFPHPGTGASVTGTMTRRLSLEPSATLVVEATRDGVLGGPATTTRTVYRKVS